MRKLPPPMAQRIASVLKGPAGASQPPATPAAATPGTGAPGAAGPGMAGSGGSRPGGGGPPDFQQMISRLPAGTLADLQKEETVMIVSTPGTKGAEGTAITFPSGVGPIPPPPPNRKSAAALLS